MTLKLSEADMNHVTKLLDPPLDATLVFLWLWAHLHSMCPIKTMDMWDALVFMRTSGWRS